MWGSLYVKQREIKEKKTKLNFRKVLNILISKHLKRAVSFAAAAVICFSAMDKRELTVLADSVSELEAEISANEEAIAEKRALMRELSEQSDSAKAYISALSDKMDLQQENIDIINSQLAELSEGIEEKENEIAELEVKISEKKAEIDEDIEVFRERLRSMYISGNDSTASILTGASDFYDLLARYELISRIAENDDDMIDDLTVQLDDFKAQNDELVLRKEELSQQKRNAEIKRDVLMGEMNALIDEYEESQQVLAEIASDEELTESDISWLNARNDELSSRIDDIREQERIAAEEARREAEERRRQQEEEERLRREEEERRAAEEALREEYQNYELYDDYDGDYSDYNGGYSDVEEEASYDFWYEPQHTVSCENYENRDDIVDYAKTYLGVYYQWCGNYPSEGYYGLDCSHFTYRVLQHFGLMDSYMDSRGQCSYCTPISADELMPGDLVFYQNSSGRVEHVTMYIGNGQIIGCQGGDSWVDTQSEAESMNAKVKIVSLYSDGRYMTYGRVPGMY